MWIALLVWLTASVLLGPVVGALCGGWRLEEVALS
jgi:hypothetical protein